MSSRPYEIIVLGATGWTATICAEHIARAFPINTKWSIAGRSAAKLEALRQSLRIINPDRLEPTVHIVSQLDAQSLDPLVKAANVIINGVGPYHRYATPVVEACARNGTHYADFSTEKLWISEMIRDYHELAVSSGATIIPSISGPSAPSDLAAWLIVSYLGRHGLPAASEVICSGEMTMLGMRGGSLHTVLDVAENYGVRGWLTVDTYISVVLIHIISKIGILFLAVPWFRSFFRTKSFSPGDGPDRTESRKTESAEWKAVGYVTGVAEPVAFSRFAFQGALVDMAAILAVEAVATINDKLKFKDSNQVKASLSTPSTLGQTFVDRLRTTGFTIEIEGSRNADQMAGTL
ncbi:Saccharopine dehydrogenase-domain-containing protein [Fusarium venenatum]|uniref:Saccharopine dehydrogenase-domain-containing protein n=1 Tax=Fusarium venenatum TaxID=56646 RepID=UPI001E06C8E0|nr:Saccharopine dehydrogenase-domain-containing protein [Fusarium venenatum]